MLMSNEWMLSSTPIEVEVEDIGKTGHATLRPYFLTDQIFLA